MQPSPFRPRWPESDCAGSPAGPCLAAYSPASCELVADQVQPLVDLHLKSFRHIRRGVVLLDDRWAAEALAGRKGVPPQHARLPGSAILIHVASGVAAPCT